MKKILYIAFICPEHLGVSKKISKQVEFWREGGVNVTVVLDKCEYGVFFKILYRYLTLLSYFILHRSPSSFIYLRQTVCLPFFSWICRFRRFSYEVNADAANEARTFTGLKKLSLILLRDEFITRAYKTFFVSGEIEGRYRNDASNTYVYANCIHGLEHRLVFPRKNKVVFVGNQEQAWQGVDILLTIAKNMPEYEFHLVGNIDQPDVENVYAHGLVTGDAYNNLMKTMDYAIGTLAFFRSGLLEGSALKVRDYIKHDLPVVISYKDSDFDGAVFALKIDVENINVGQIQDFFNFWKSESIISLVDNDWLCRVRESRRANQIVSD